MLFKAEQIKELSQYNTVLAKTIYPPNHLYFKFKAEWESELKAKEDLKAQRKGIQSWAKDNLIGKATVRHKDIPREIHFTTTGIKEALNQSHNHYKEKNEAIKSIVSIIEESKYYSFANDMKDNADVKGYYYLEF